MTGWHQGRFAALDFETTGVSTEDDRIVSAALIGCGGGHPTDTHTWLVNPGIEIPAEATKVHGITTEQVQADGQPAAAALEDIAKRIAGYLIKGIPLVGHNIGGYDLTLLDRELRRHGLEPIAERVGVCGPVIDTMVLDKHVLPFRKRVSKDQGARQLKTLAEVYGIAWVDADAHGAAYDALLAARIAYKIGAIANTRRTERPEWVAEERRELFDDLAGATVLDLHDRQAIWSAEQRTSFQAFMRRTAPEFTATGTAPGDWPLLPYEAQLAIGQAS